MHKMAKDKLDITKSFHGQDMKTIKQICNAVSLLPCLSLTLRLNLITKVSKEYSILKDYEQDWPMHNILKLHLKYTSKAACCSLTVSTAKKIEKVH